MSCLAQRAFPTLPRVNNIPYSFLFIIKTNIHVPKDVEFGVDEARQEDNPPIEELLIEDTLPSISTCGSAGIVLLIALLLEHFELAPK